MRHARFPGLVTVPVHGAAIVKPSVLKSILIQAGAIEEFRERL